jgi:hypothetical protein
MTRKPGLGSLILAGLAAWGLYKYSKMNPDEKRNLVEKGKKLVNDNLGGLNNIVGKKTTTTENAGNGSLS